MFVKIGRYFFAFIALSGLAFFSAIPSLDASSEKSLMGQVVKLQTYTYNEQSQSYVLAYYGSAVVIAKNRIITNAHVILDSDGEKPTGLYEICTSDDYQSAPKCNRTARLLAYDPVADLALLEPSVDFSSVPVHLESNIQKPISIGQTVVIYGYPTIGGETITRTEGKIAGYQNPVYKIDASIDHGNSGGGAFDDEGNLIGIPYAVSSDNGVIGYMISRKVIDEFLTEKTLGYTIVQKQSNLNFERFLSQNHIQMQRAQYIRGGGLEIFNPKNSGFHLANTVSDSGSGLFSWLFNDNYGRVSLYIACTKDAGKHYGYEIDAMTLDSTQLDSPDYILTGATVGKNNEFYHVHVAPKVPRNDGSQEFTDTWYYKNYDACYAQIYSTHTSQDNVLVQKAEKIIQSAKFRNAYSLPVDQSNPYFSVSDILDSVRSTFYIDTDGTKKVSLEFLLNPTRSIEAQIRSEKYDSRNDYFTKPFYTVDAYTGSLTFDSLLQQFATNIDNTKVQTLLSKNKKKMIFSYKMSTVPETKNTVINVFYPYKIGSSYYVWSWSKTFRDGSLDHVQMIAQFFSQMNLPGEEAFP
ncbi:MAG: trypsin-like peptidase domain-containing protein [Candidatus Gracilibacteria bacterium]|nr:trypsin-like peptidase domain-containing protein [Candidatus Gracilibacteria bacterium]